MKWTWLIPLIAVSACSAIRGQKMGATLIGNPWLTATDLYYDPLNLSGYASDLNNGISLTTPVLTYRTLVGHQGGISPPVAQNIHVISGNAGLNDPIQRTPCVPPQEADVIEGTVTTIGSCIITAVTNRVIGTVTSAGTQALVTASCLTAV